MAKLPATSYVRMVDIWLIFVQLYPFIEAIWFEILALHLLHFLKVVLYTIIEIYNDEEFTNLHGLRRVVPENLRPTKVSVCTVYMKILWQ